MYVGFYFAGVVVGGLIASVADEVSKTNEEFKKLPSDQKGSLFKKIKLVRTAMSTKNAIHDEYTHTNHVKTLAQLNYLPENYKNYEQSILYGHQLNPSKITLLLNRLPHISIMTFQRLPNKNNSDDIHFGFTGELDRVKEDAHNEILKGNYIRCPNVIPDVEQPDAIVTETNDCNECDILKKSMISAIAFSTVADFQFDKAPHGFYNTLVVKKTDQKFEIVGTLKDLSEENKEKISNEDFEIQLKFPDSKGNIKNAVIVE
ncbi:MAG: hypothetical protein JHC93_02720 [Parachlamydiales bacterium]|nr:hypothetical protein [Parachlamydiales bacterium]